jgi:hypothetical protein
MTTKLETEHRLTFLEAEILNIKRILYVLLAGSGINFATVILK